MKKAILTIIVLTIIFTVLLTGCTENSDNPIVTTASVKHTIGSESTSIPEETETPEPTSTLEIQTPTPTVETTPEPTETPEPTQESTPTVIPTIAPTTAPTKKPTIIPTVPTQAPTKAPTTPPTQAPTPTPTAVPTQTPVKDEEEVDAILYRFYAPDNYMWKSDTFINSKATGVGMTATGPACTYFCDPVERALVIQIHTVDPYFAIKGGEDGKTFNLSEYPVFKIRLKNETVSTTFETHLMITNGATYGDRISFFISGEDKTFKNYVYDIGQQKGPSFLAARNPISGIRLDGLSIYQHELEMSEATPYLHIEYFGFFKTMEDAVRWNPPHLR